MSRDIILVIDMLRGFLESGHSLYCGDDARKIIEPISSYLASNAAKAKMPFDPKTLDPDALVPVNIFVGDCHSKTDLEFKMFPPHCIRGTSECEVIPELKQYMDVYIPKTRYSALYNTDLMSYIKAFKPTTITVVGVCTDICVLHTVADLRNRDYTVLVPINMVASFDPQAHLAAIKHMDRILGAKIMSVI